jgi:hypothetical protein
MHMHSLTAKQDVSNDIILSAKAILIPDPIVADEDYPVGHPVDSSDETLLNKHLTNNFSRNSVND